jgi:hypothetical protein
VKNVGGGLDRFKSDFHGAKFGARQPAVAYGGGISNAVEGGMSCCPTLRDTFARVMSQPGPEGPAAILRRSGLSGQTDPVLGSHQFLGHARLGRAQGRIGTDGG